MSPTQGVIGEAWRLYKRHWQHLVAIAFIVYIVVAVISAVLIALLTWLGSLLAFLLGLVAVFYLQAALAKAVEDVHDGRADMSLGETLEAARPHLTPVIVGAVLAAVGIVLGLLLFVVPGLYLLTIWSLIIPVIVLENRSSGEAFTRSRELVRGWGMNVFGVLLLLGLLFAGFYIVLGIVLIPVNDWIQGFVSTLLSWTFTASFWAVVVTLLYIRLRAAKEQPATPTPPPATPA
jgi:hypothetical protein